MLERESVEGILRQASSAIERWDDQIRPPFLATEIKQLLTDYLALRAIVEELASDEPIQSTPRGTWECEQCGAEAISYRHDFEHRDDCLWAKAVALLLERVEE